MPACYAQWSGTQRDEQIRLTIFAAAFEVWPLNRHQSVDTAILKHIELTSDIPVFALEPAVTALLDDPSQDFRPGVGKIRRAATIYIENVRRWIRGERSKIGLIEYDRDHTSAAMACAIKLGREMVGQPHPDGATGRLVTPRYLGALVERGPRTNTPEALSSITDDTIEAIKNFATTTNDDGGE